MPEETIHNEMKKSVLLLLFALICLSSYAQKATYKTLLIRATPGKLSELIDNWKMRSDKTTAAKPVIMRHSQGDQWDLMVMVPLNDSEEFETLYNFEYGDSYFDLVARQEDGIATGPTLSEFNLRMNEGGYYHVEMFISVAGKQNELKKQREMENVYLNEIGRAPNLVFTSTNGFEFDIFTVGIYRDIKHFAESADIPIEKEDAAAKKAGFESVYTIGFYLRSLISEHHDTLANRVK